MDSIPPISSLIDLSWKRTKQILFPFRFKRWLKILLIVWLSGQAAGGGGNFNVPRLPKRTPTQTQTAAFQPNLSNQGESPIQAPDLGAMPQVQPAPSAAPTTALPSGPALILAVIAAVFVLVIVLVFMWLSARFNFILLDFVVSGNASIREGFRKFRDHGNSFFRWSLAFMGIGIVFLTVAGLIGMLLWSVAKFTLWFFIPVAAILFLGLGLLGLLVADFVLPIMYQSGRRTWAAVKEFFEAKPNIGSIALYLLLKLGLGIVAGIVVAVTALVVAVIVLIAALIVALPGFFLYNVAGFLGPVLIGLGFAGGVLVVIGLILIIGLLTLPIPIFFRSFSVLYLVRLDRRYNLLSGSFPEL